MTGSKERRVNLVVNVTSTTTRFGAYRPCAQLHGWHYCGRRAGDVYARYLEVYCVTLVIDIVLISEGGRHVIDLASSE
jgi:hypothetical protein